MDPAKFAVADPARTPGVAPSPDRPLHGAPFPPGRWHPRLYLAELVGTALLVGVGLSIVIVMFGTASPVAAWLPGVGERRFLTGALFGSVGALLALSPVGKVSGAHLNPAVTLAFWLEGKLAGRDAAGYVLAQLAGGVLGALPLRLWGALGRSVEYGGTVPGPGISPTVAVLAEAGVTFALVGLIFTLASHARLCHLTPLALPALFSVLVLVEAPLTGTSANPARSFGPAVVAGVWQGQWVYFVGPCLGAAVAVGVLRLELTGPRRVLAARLAHFHLP
ncbi:MIP/aquaporin family protein [Deinococcus planocerae]|uniref:MIP/aquaporin family protein n=1 Tax=Deinococcus planocerae TaxID=1737569 RepID=UPI000C7F2D45|nr:aquaporin [Deinococcus planocerae]